MLFIKILSEFKLKANTIWVDKSNEFYIRSARSWFQSNIIEMYLTNHLGKYVCNKRFIRTLKTKIYKCMTSISENMYIDKLDDIVNKYNNTYTGTIEMKAVCVKIVSTLTSVKKVRS